MDVSICQMFKNANGKSKTADNSLESRQTGWNEKSQINVLRFGSDGMQKTLKYSGIIPITTSVPKIMV
jgi:hypothetical protein